MIYLITGANGNGKTLYAIDWVSRFADFKGRHIYTHGIKDLDHEWLGSSDFEDPKKWYELPDHSVIVIDEAWKFFPPMSPSAERPQHYTDLAEHRARGIDLVLITQAGQDMDTFVRRRLWRHIYCHRWDGGEHAMIFEFKEFETNPLQKQTQLRALDSTEWKFPKDVYTRYTSAKEHTGRQLRPKWFWILRLGWIPVVVFIYIIYSQVTRDRSGFTDSVGGGNSVGQSAPSSSRGSGSRNAPMTREQYLAMFIPRIDNAPWSAPMFDDVMKVQAAPKLICYRNESDNSCKCFTQQMTLENISFEVCNFNVLQGWFDFSKEDYEPPAFDIAKTSRKAVQADSPASSEFQGARGKQAAPRIEPQEYDPNPGRATRNLKRYTNWNKKN